MITYDNEGNQYDDHKGDVQSKAALLEQQNKQAELEAQRVAQQKSAGFNADGSPIAKEFASNLDASGLLKAPYQLSQFDPSKLDSYNMQKALATGTGLTESGKLREQQIQQNQTYGNEAAAREAMSGGAAARSSLAARGGLSGGARERIAQGMGGNLLDARQAQSRNASSGMLQNMLADQQRRDQALQSFGGMEQQLAGANKDVEKYNISGALQESQAKRNFENDQYKAELDKWGAGKQAEATRASSGGGGKK